MSIFQKIKNYFSSLKKKILFLGEESIIVDPQEGDVIEFSDGLRKVVHMCEDEDIYVSKGVEIVPNRRGRSRSVLCLEKISWPEEGSLLYREGKLLYPRKNIRLMLVVWFSNKLLKHKK